MVVSIVWILTQISCNLLEFNIWESLQQIIREVLRRFRCQSKFWIITQERTLAEILCASFEYAVCANMT